MNPKSIITMAASLQITWFILELLVYLAVYFLWKRKEVTEGAPDRACGGSSRTAGLLRQHEASDMPRRCTSPYDNCQRRRLRADHRDGRSPC